MGGYNEQPDLGTHLISLEERIAALERASTQRGTISPSLLSIGTASFPTRTYGVAYQPNPERPTLVVAVVGTLAPTTGTSSGAVLVSADGVGGWQQQSYIEIFHSSFGDTDAAAIKAPVVALVPAGYYYMVQGGSAGQVMEITL